MGGKHRVDKENNSLFETEQKQYQKWAPVFQHLGLKPRRFIGGADAAYICTVDGWLRLSMHKYSKEELQWLRNIMAYLEERSFKNWASAWQRTMIWEESNCCYLIQPWLFGRECFQPGDPAAVERAAEILADLYRCGKDYRENRGMEVCRDRWSTVATKWKEELSWLQTFKEDFDHDKNRKETHGLCKETEALLTECISSWEAGMNALYDHHYQLGVLGHGALQAKYLVWGEDDYFLLNWEQIAFQPKIVDLADLINDVAVWDAEWIIYLINQYTRIQPLWPEEYQALKALLSYPGTLLQLLRAESGKEFDYKASKDVDKELKRKGRCLDKVWRELTAEKNRWAGGKEYVLPKNRENGRLSLVLSPAESWGMAPPNQIDTLIHVSAEDELPTDIWQRLVSAEPDRVLGGREGNIMEAAAPVQMEETLGMAEIPVHVALEEVKLDGAETNAPANRIDEVTDLPENQSALSDNKEKNEEKQPSKELISWVGFPKPMKRGNGQ